MQIYILRNIKAHYAISDNRKDIDEEGPRCCGYKVLRAFQSFSTKVYSSRFQVPVGWPGAEIMSAGDKEEEGRFCAGAPCWLAYDLATGDAPRCTSRQPVAVSHSHLLRTPDIDWVRGSVSSDVIFRSFSQNPRSTFLTNCYSIRRSFAFTCSC